jgi:hypothetical protein
MWPRLWLTQPKGGYSMKSIEKYTMKKVIGPGMGEIEIFIVSALFNL